MTTNTAKLAALIFMALLFSNCENSTKPEPSVSYSKILFKREGGGNKHFYATTNFNKEIIINVTRWNFKDTNYTVTKSDTGNLSAVITNLLENKSSISGKFKQPTNSTGTWAYLYVVSSDNKETEITNTSVRDSLMALESIAVNSR